jgi:hypothetical protein
VTTIQKTEPEGWEAPQTILVILAHPDDPEFFCGASIARWTSLGHTVHYCLLTRGDKGVRVCRAVADTFIPASQQAIPFIIAC